MPISQTKGYFENVLYLFLAILKIPCLESMFFLLALKWNLQEKVFFCVKTKTNSNFAVKPAERSNRSFSVHWLCKQIKKVRTSQASVSMNSCTELSKAHFFPLSVVKYIPFWDKCHSCTIALCPFHCYFLFRILGDFICKETNSCG